MGGNAAGIGGNGAGGMGGVAPSGLVSPSGRPETGSEPTMMGMPLGSGQLSRKTAQIISFVFVVVVVTC